jgi:hypothetical protein
MTPQQPGIQTTVTEEVKTLADTVAPMLAIFGQLTKLVKPLLPNQLAQIASGEAKLVLLTPGQRVVEPLPGLDATLRLLRKLTAEEAEQVSTGDAKIVLVPRGAKVIRPLDLRELAKKLSQLDSQEEIVQELSSDSRLTVARLKELAYEMNVNVPSQVKTKGPLQIHLAKTVVAHRRRSSNQPSSDELTST